MTFCYHVVDFFEEGCGEVLLSGIEILFCGEGGFLVFLLIFQGILNGAFGWASRWLSGRYGWGAGVRGARGAAVGVEEEVAVLEAATGGLFG